MTLISGYKVFSRKRKGDEISKVDRGLHSHRLTFNKMAKPRGFTVVEMLVVVAIIMIGAAFTALYSQGFYRQYKFSAFVNAVPNAVNLARARAIATQKWTSLQFLKGDETLDADYVISYLKSDPNTLFFKYAPRTTGKGKPLYWITDLSNNINPTVHFNSMGFAFPNKDATSPQPQSVKLYWAYDWLPGENKWIKHYRLNIAATGKPLPLETGND